MIAKTQPTKKKKKTLSVFTYFYVGFIDIIQIFLTKDFLLFFQELSFVLLVYSIDRGILYVI